MQHREMNRKRRELLEDVAAYIRRGDALQAGANAFRLVHLCRSWARQVMRREQRQARRAAIASLGMREVRGALGGRYIE